MDAIHEHVGEPRTLTPSKTNFCSCLKNHEPAPLILHVHHIWPLGHGGPDVDSNKVTLCPTSHYGVHVLLAWMLKNSSTQLPPEFDHVNRHQLRIALHGYAAIREHHK